MRDPSTSVTPNYFVGYTTRLAGGPLFTSPLTGRSYSGTLVSIDRSNADADLLRAAGWITLADHTGTTAQRPVDLEQGGTLPAGFRYWDTTLSFTVVWTGRGWINANTGVAA